MMNDQNVVRKNWIDRGKSVKQLIKELQSFSDPDLLVEISVDDGQTHQPISLVVKEEGRCLLVYSGEQTERS